MRKILITEQQLDHILEHQLIETKDYYDFWDISYVYDTIQEFLHDKANGKTKKTWRLIPFEQYRNALIEFMRYGQFMRFPAKYIDQWADIVTNNTLSLAANTELAGHSRHFPFEEFCDAFGFEQGTPEYEKYYGNYENCAEYLYDIGFDDWTIAPDGTDAISDYGLEPLYNLIMELEEQETPEQKIVVINKILDVYHMRGDLASLFIQGGTKSLSQISYPEPINENVNKGHFVNIDTEDENVRLELWEDNDKLELLAIVIPKDLRGQGYGSKLMEKIITYADSVNKPIYLTPDKSYGATSVNRLKDFYKQFGFKKNQDLAVSQSMVRYPKQLNENANPQNPKTNMLLDVANKLVNDLNELGIGAYIWHAATTGSVYIRFDDNRMGSVRLGDHEGRNKLKYKFNIRTDLKLSKGKWVKDDGKWRYFLPIHLWKEMIDVLIKQHDFIQDKPESKYQYTIPKYKQQQNGGENKTIEELDNIDEMAYPTSFNMDDFKAIKSFAGRVDYCRQNLTRIAEGSSRMVFQIDDEKVLKLAKNNKGLIQNEAEARMGANENYYTCIAYVKDFDEDKFTFVEMEKARKCSRNDFKRLTGVDFNTAVDFIRAEENGTLRKEFSQEYIDEVYDERLIMAELIDFIRSWDMARGDLYRLEHYGVVKRDGEEYVVLIDYGLTEKIFAKHYNKTIEELDNIDEMLDPEWLEQNPDYYVNRIANGNDDDDRITPNDERLKEYENLINQIKNISINEIKFKSEKSNNGMYVTVIIKNAKFTDELIKSLNFNPRIFTIDNREKMFGLKYRVHTHSIPSELRNIGFGYKLYKALIIKLGYITSGDSSFIDSKAKYNQNRRGGISEPAAAIYLKLLNDPDFYHVIDVKNKATLVIWKNYPKLDNLISYVEKYEKKYNLTFNYDKRLDLIKTNVDE